MSRGFKVRAAEQQDNKKEERENVEVAVDQDEGCRVEEKPR